MKQTILALSSILAGIIGANIFGRVFSKYSFNITGNTISGVFGSIFFIKSFGRLGFDPSSIMRTDELNILLFTVNLVVSLIAGGIAVFIANRIKNGMNKNKAVKS